MSRLRLALAAVLALSVPLAAQARDEQLVSDMCALEKAYINPLFFTSSQNLPKTTQTFQAFVASWQTFAATYRTYRPDAANWGARFDEVDEAVASAEAIVAAARASCPLPPPGQAVPLCPQLVPAHDALEAVRYAMLRLRTHNGFPKFFTDKLTAFHDPMEAIVLSVKDLSPAAISDELLAVLAASVAEADFLWSAVEQTPLDAAWGFDEAESAAIRARVVAERYALDAFAAAVAAANRDVLPALAVSLKARFVPVYTSFAGDAALNKLP